MKDDGTTAPATRYGPEPAPQAEAAGSAITLRLAPADGRDLDIAERDTGLWSLAETLAPGETLGLAYRLGRTGELAADVVVSLSALNREPLSTPAPRSQRRTALERAARLAFPGFVARDVAQDPLACAASLPVPRLDPLAPQVEAAAPTRPREVVGTRVDPALLLPARRAGRLRLVQALGAIAQLRLRVDLHLRIDRFIVDAAMLRILETTDAALCARLHGAAGDPQGTLRLEYCRARIRDWCRAQAGLRLRLSLTAAEQPDPDLVALVGNLLHGHGLCRDVPPPGAIDLAGCMPVRSPARPALVPNPNLLVALALQRPCQLPDRTPGAIRIGHDAANRPVTMSRTDSARHTFVIGATGVGKSTLLATMIAQDVAAGRAVVLVDPHGDLFAQARDALHGTAKDRVILADAGDFVAPFGLNLLEITSEPAAVQRNFIANQLIGVFKSVLYRGVPEAFGPMFEAYFRNALMLLMEAEGDAASLTDFDRVFGEAAYRRHLLERCEDQQVRRFWKEIATRAGGEAALENIAPYICTKLTQFTGNPLLRPIIAAPQTTIDIPGAMARGEPVLVNLAKGLIGEQDAALLGGLMTIRIFCAAMARSTLPPEKRTRVRLYLDEFATYATGVVAQMRAECRKFGLELVLAGQSLDQVDGRADRPDVAHAILANVGSILAFRTGPNDARRLADWFAPEIAAETLSRLPDRCLVARLLDGGRPASPRRVWTEAATHDATDPD